MGSDDAQQVPAPAEPAGAEPTPATPPTPGRSSRLPSGFTTIRDVLSFVLGVGIICNEVFFQPTVETASMTVGIALVGLPLAFGADERRKNSS